jgi:hypothetical protein
VVTSAPAARTSGAFDVIGGEVLQRTAHLSKV